MPKLPVEQMEQFNRDGYLMIEGLFDAEEMSLLMRIAKADQQIKSETSGGGSWESTSRGKL